MKVSVIIPAYNEARRIGHVLSRIPRGYEVIVVDDGSHDTTLQEIRKCNATAIRLKTNQGKTKACLTGIARSTSDMCIFLDGDGQHYPEDMPAIAAALRHADICIGVRDMKRVPLQRRLGNRYARTMMRIITGRDFPDVLCGFRGVRKNKFKSLTFEKGGYFFESEMAMKATAHGFRISFVPVRVSYESGANMGMLKSLEVAWWLLRKAAAKIFMDLL